MKNCIMSKMNPPFILPGTQSGERQVYHRMEELPEQWIVFHNCWEHYREKEKYVNYEADFIVLIPQLGIVVIEVKDWPHVRIKNGVWQSKGKNENGEWISLSRKQSPLNQAFINSKKLTQSLINRGILENDSRRQPEIRSLAILTNCVPENLLNTPITEDERISKKHHLPLSTLYLCGREELENNLQARIERLFINKRKKSGIMTEELTREIEDYLAPNMFFRLDFSNYTETMENTAQNLFHLLPRLEESTGGIRVDGCAGSGKTEMALREVRRLAAQTEGSKSILLLCYNNNLVYRLKRALKGCKNAKCITVSGFHDYCINSIIIPSAQEQLIRYDGNTPYLDEAGWSWVEQNPTSQPRHDYIFVDEAQDFKPNWWNIIRSRLTEKGKLYIFADENQDLYGRCNGLPDLPTRIRLTQNLRCAWKIAHFSSELLPDLQMDALPMSGAPLKIGRASDSPEERARQISEIIQKLKTNRFYNIHNSDIVVLSPWRAENERCSLRYCNELDFAHGTENAAETAERHERCRRRDSTRILADTIKGYKGLEAAFVILTDICATDEHRGFRTNDFYVACTRARFGLFIIPTVSGKQMIKKLLHPHAHLPERT